MTRTQTPTLQTRSTPPVPKPKGAAPFSTVKRLGITSLDDGVLRFDDKRSSTTFRIEGIDPHLRSQTERDALVRGLTGTVRAIKGAFSFYADKRPLDMQQAITQLAETARTETASPMLIPHYWYEHDLIRTLHAQHGLTERRYWVSVQDIPDRVVMPDVRQRLNELLHPKHEQTFGFRRTRVQQTATESKEANHLRFRRGRALASFTRLGLTATDTTDAEYSDALGELIGVPASVRSDSRRSAIERISAATWQETAHAVQIGPEQWVSCLWIHDFPRQASFGVLSDVLCIPDVSLTLAVHVTPWDSARAIRKLRGKQDIIAVLRNKEARSSTDLRAVAREETARQLQLRGTRGEKIYRVGVRIAVRSTTEAAAMYDAQMVQAQLEELGFGVAGATYNQSRAYQSCLPTGRDPLATDAVIGALSVHPNLYQEDIACLFPAVIVDFTADGGTMLGVSKDADGLVLYNRWSRKVISPHAMFAGTTGGGKSHSLAIECTRELLAHKDLTCWYIDPQGMAVPWAEAIGATVLDAGTDGGQCINLLDRFSIGGRPELFAKKLVAVFPLFGLMLGEEMTQNVRSVLHAALKATYAHYEAGASMMETLALNFSHNARYAPLREHLGDSPDGTPGIMSRLNAIYAELHRRYHIPGSGRVAGIGEGDDYRRPICTFDSARNCWVYAGAGETSTPYRPVQARMIVDQAFAAATPTRDTDQTPTLDADQTQTLVETLVAAYTAGGKPEMYDLRSTQRAVKEAFAPLTDDPALAPAARVLLRQLDRYGMRPRPPLVWQPDPLWADNLSADYLNRVRIAGLFTALDPEGQRMAERDAFGEMKRGIPILADAFPFITAQTPIYPVARKLVPNLEQYADPDGLGRIFNGQTNIRLDNRAIVFNMADVGEAESVIRVLRTAQIITFLWDAGRASRTKHLLVLDELGDIFESFPEVGELVRRLYQRGRYFGFSIMGAVQNFMSLTGSRAAKICFELSGRIVVLKLEDRALPEARAWLTLTQGEEDILRHAEEGDSLQFISRKKGQVRLQVHYEISKPHLAILDTKRKDDDEGEI